MDNTFTFEGVDVGFDGELADHALLTALRDIGVSCREISSPDQVSDCAYSLFLLSSALLSRHPASEWRDAILAADQETLLVAESGISADVDLILPPGLPVQDCLRNIHLALRRWVLQRENYQLKSVLGKTEQDLELLAEIGIALSAEKNLDRLLERILREAQQFACCDAASLYLVEKHEHENDKLAFKLTNNDSIAIDFREQRFDLDNRSIVGYVATMDQELNIRDAHNISDQTQYSFNPEMDARMGYRTVSILTLPLRNYRGEVIGVLQFINKKTDRALLLTSPELALEYTEPFQESLCKILRALASQSAIAIENSVLLDNINRLFSGFVQASVSAIEQRDPTTSGHSFRVADLTTELAIKLPLSDLAEYRSIHFDEQQIRELRYAALLHDFGKVGVREHVLVKSKKLPERQFDIVRYRIRLTQEQLRRQASEQMLALHRDSGSMELHNRIEQQLKAELERLEGFLRAVEQSNEPTVLDDGDFEHLEELRAYPFAGQDEPIANLLTEDEFTHLSIRKGSLSLDERREIESHAQHTANFLRLIPWTPELARIPELAESHHEKLDGSGYPHGLKSEAIPLGSKLMAICDIYDALTASDRPYKAAMPSDKAYGILEMEAKEGKLDRDLVGVFINAGVNRVLDGKDYKAINPQQSPGGEASHHPCDPEDH